MKFLAIISLFLGGCTTLPQQFHASERHCKYDRVGVEYELECSSKGIVELTNETSVLEALN